MPILIHLWIMQSADIPNIDQFNRVPNACNTFLDQNRDLDIWVSGMAEFRARVRQYVRGR